MWKSLSIGLLVVGCGLTLAAPVPGADAASASSGKYIISLKSGIDPDISLHHLDWVGQLHRRSVYRRGENGTASDQLKLYQIGGFDAYAGIFDHETLAQIRASDVVASVEEDVHVYTAALTSVPNAPWPLARLSNRNAGSHTFCFDSSAGTGTWAYTIDGGINPNHTEFEGRAMRGPNFVTGSPNMDQNGHGTHVAAIIAGKTYGVAKHANIVAIKATGADHISDLSITMDAFKWAVNDIKSKGREAKSVINMSIATGVVSTAFNGLIDGATNEGILSVVCAGNEAHDASNDSPASANSAITVGAIDSNDLLPGWTNYGPGVDIFAPGVEVLSANFVSDTAVHVLSGTSMAAPHVAGLALYLKSYESGLDSPVDTTNRIISLATTGQAKNLRGSPDRIAYYGCDVAAEAASKNCKTNCAYRNNGGHSS